MLDGIGSRRRGSEIGYGGPQVCKIVGISYRQLDYWARTDLLRPSLADAAGSGTQRRYSYRDLVALKVIKSLLDAGVSLQTARKAIDYLRDHLGEDWATASLVLDGSRSVLVRTGDDIVDVVRQGQGVLNIVPLAARGAARREHPRARRRRRAEPTCRRDRRGERRRGRLTIIRTTAAARAGAASRTTPSGSSRSCSTSTAIEWEYEPRTFTLERDRDGNPAQAFTPDFYLPAYDLYIEITTLNQKLVTKKNRKARRLRELYPDVRIKVLYQRDYLHLLVKYGLEPPSQLVGDAGGARRRLDVDPRNHAGGAGPRPSPRDGRSVRA